eukprot:CAMPEP_0113534008 /NCGR_PEP_ID=MMETSP0015_2-20120614/4928_1 /TAXON_ID=2838 /ORGANISM="Odontella" /LENGTH=210 /DNA_ID=CAMNT_0000433137 /DNA_START=133 /DNA_END=765 /DNA_ORIENTATION=+ /assembly_acc=CAM_ASM_000160
MPISTSAPGRPAEDGEVIMLSGYPFYVSGPNPEKVAAVAEEVGRVLRDACGDQLKAVDRMGSSAIDGIAGTPVCDVLAQLSPWPMADDAKERLIEIGFTFQGSAPHDPQDEWFFGGKGEPGHLGRVVLHTVPEGSQFVSDMKAFVEYVKYHPEAFKRYNDVKVEGARVMAEGGPGVDGQMLGYKKKKNDVCNEIRREAIEWWKREGHYKN